MSYTVGIPGANHCGPCHARGQDGICILGHPAPTTQSAAPHTRNQREQQLPKMSEPRWITLREARHVPNDARHHCQLSFGPTSTTPGQQPAVQNPLGTIGNTPVRAPNIAYNMSGRARSAKQSASRSIEEIPLSWCRCISWPLCARVCFSERRYKVDITFTN